MREATVFTTEADFRKWFEKNLSTFGVRRIVLSQEVCPDYVVEMETGEILKVEAELFAINFKYHGHDPAKADLIIACYSRSESVEGVPVRALHRLWCFDLEVLDPMSPEASLSENEARLLSSIHSSGGLNILAISQGSLVGDAEIWMRVRPELIAAIPHSRIIDNIFNVLSQETKEWLRKYHHVLIAARISEHGCELLESLYRRGLIYYRPLSWIAAVYDGAIVEHPAWLPTEVVATKNAWKYHEADIMKYLFG